MKTLKSKAMAILVTALLTFSMTASMMLIPSANAHTPPWNIPTYAFMAANPSPVQLGQSVNIGFWLDQPPPTAEAQYGDRWTGFTVKITLPDGTTTTLGPFTSDDTGGTHTEYTPTELGNYTLVFNFPGQTLAGKNLAPGELPANYANIGDYYEPSSATTTLIVQSAPIVFAPVASLPTQYWTRPINAMNNNWYSIAGNWLGLGGTGAVNAGGGMYYNATGNYNPWTLAPTTAHILWTKPEGFGGTVGGEFGGSETGNYYATRQYEKMFQPIIMQGILYNEMYSGSATYPSGFSAIDLQTGQTLWTDSSPGGTLGSTTNQPADFPPYTSGPVLRCGQLLDYVSPNQFGVSAYIWTVGYPFGSPTLTGSMLTVPAAQQTTQNPGGYATVTTTLASFATTWNMYDAATGDYILSIVNGTTSASMPLTEDQSGDLIGYYVNTTVGTQIINGVPVTNPHGGELLECWNSTRAILLSQPAEYYGATSPDAWYWRPPLDGIIPFSLGIEWAVPLATSIAGAPLPSALAISAINSGYIVMTSSAVTVSITGTGSYQPGWEIEAGYNANTGAQVWITNRTETPFTRLNGITSLMAGGGVYVNVDLDTSTAVGYSMSTGAQLWTTVLPNCDPYDSIGGFKDVLANGVMYLWGFGGDVFAINMATGAILWQTTTDKLLGSAGANTPYGVWPLWTFCDGSVADGILFVPVGHEYSPPLFRGAQQIAINCTNGQLVWSAFGFYVNGPSAISDGIMTVINAYDNQIYAYGMGPSKTTVTAPDVGVTTATPITITGTVTDISAGSQQNAVAANFPNGLPCVSDASMSQFMEAVYMQQPMPTNITGVPVEIAVLDSNGNHYPIGTATTDASGTYSLTWTPDIPGNFTVYAIFAGTQSYYGSSAEAHFYAGSPAPTGAPTAAPPSGLASTGTVMLAAAAIIIVIVIIGAVLAVLMLRKKP